jgi:hypothetical protein
MPNIGLSGMVGDTKEKFTAKTPEQIPDKKIVDNFPKGLTPVCRYGIMGVSPLERNPIDLE